MLSIFSYVLRYDDGAAPNPFYGTCTLAICKPAIRRKAEVGDWVVGTVTKNSSIGDISDQVVYAMKVTKKMTMHQYDEYCRQHLTGKIPKWFTGTYKERMGDCIYDYSSGQVSILRPSVHKELNRKRDLSGRFVLLSDEFFYFGDKPVPLPEELRTIVKTNQGHKRIVSEHLIKSFESWIYKFPLNKLKGQPQLKKKFTTMRDIHSKCSLNDYKEDKSSREEVVC
jgi:hypothetical protein